MNLDSDINAFYREQDRRMNLPDDDFNEYLSRMNTRTRQEADRPTSVSGLVYSEESIHAIPSLEDRLPSSSANNADGVIHNVQMLSSVNKEHHEVASKVPSQLSPNSGDSSFFQEFVKNSANLSALDDDPRSSIPSRITQLAGAEPETPASSRSAMYAPEMRKRKPSSGHESETSPNKKRSRSVRSLPETPSMIEEITSFTASPTSKKRSIDLLAGDLPRQQVQPSPKKRKIPPLKLPTLAPPVQTEQVTDSPHAHTSPIEDANELISRSISVPPTSENGNRAALQAGPSCLYLEVKERVAQHSSTKRRDKVMKLNAKNARKIAVRPSEPSIIDISSSPPPDRSRLAALASNAIKSSSTSRRITKDDKSKPKPIKGKKGKLAAMTPGEYALMLREKATLGLAPGVTKRKTVNKFLQGMNIFYTGGDMQFASEQTRGRMNLVVKYGGNLFPTYDASLVTHIITDTSMASTLNALGLNRLSEIPDHIPTVTWKWIAAGIGRVNKEGWKDEIFLHAAFGERIDAGINRSRSSGKGKEKVNNNAEFSRISEFTQDKLRRHTSVHSISSEDDVDDVEENDPTGVPPTSELRRRKSTSYDVSNVDYLKAREEDPLAEFYAQARAGHETYGEGDDSDLTPSDIDIEGSAPKTVAKRGWTCDNKETQKQICVNQDIIDKLQELKELHQAKPGDDDHWRVFSYTKCIRALRNYPKRIESFAEARAIRGVGDKTAAKIMEILETGALRRIEYERTEDVGVTRLFQGIYGVGQSTAFKWYSAGCRTLDDLTAGKGGIKLNPVQEIGIRFYDDINERMPRLEAKAIFDLIKPIALKIDPKLFIKIMGSYRRGKKNCGDIDILITRPSDDGMTHKRVLPRLLQELHATGILTEDLAVPEDPDDLEAIYRGLCRIPKEGSKRRRIDFLTVPWRSRGAALLYYTGDDIFNRAIRLKANSLGYSLNQRGLFAGVVRDPRDRRVKLNQGSLVASETEEEIFKILDVPWQEPHERVRG